MCFSLRWLKFSVFYNLLVIRLLKIRSEFFVRCNFSKYEVIVYRIVRLC